MISRASQPIRSARLSRAAVRIGQNLVWVAIAALFYVVEGAVVVTDLLARVLSPRRPTPVPPSSLDRAVAAKSYAH